jgi:hypothetical protein
LVVIESRDFFGFITHKGSGWRLPHLFRILIVIKLLPLFHLC